MAKKGVFILSNERELLLGFYQRFTAQVFLKGKDVNIRKSTAEKLFEIYKMLLEKRRLNYIDVADMLGVSQSLARRLLKIYAYIFDLKYEDGWLSEEVDSDANSF